MKRLLYVLLALLSPLLMGQGYSGGTSTTISAGTGTASVSLGGTLCKGAPAAATQGTSEEVLATCTIPANTLTAAGSSIRVVYHAHTVANGNNKALTVRIGGIAGTIVGGIQAIAANNLIYMSMSPNEIKRTAATTASVQSWGGSCVIATSPGAPSCTQGMVNTTAAAVTWANANDLVITGTTPTAAGDLVLDSYTVEVVQ